MNLQERINLMHRLGNFLEQNTPAWQEAKKRAHQKNPWFTEEFIDLSTRNIVQHFLQPTLLEKWAGHYHLDDNISPRNVGIVMAGNIPLVGFHDFLATFISGHKQTIKMSSKDDILPEFLIRELAGMDPGFHELVSTAEILKGCDAYVATGSNNSSRYFEQYFAKFPHIIRRNKTSVAILTGKETAAELEKLSDDIHQYFGMGCRNITKVFVPVGYDFIPLIRSFDSYGYFMDQHKYKNNYDYQLSIMLLNKKYYMTNGNTLLLEQESPFSPISVLHYEYYENGDLQQRLDKISADLQCIVGEGHTPFGAAQSPGLFSYADGVDIMQFLLGL